MKTNVILIGCSTLVALIFIAAQTNNTMEMRIQLKRDVGLEVKTSK